MRLYCVLPHSTVSVYLRNISHSCLTALNRLALLSWNLGQDSSSGEGDSLGEDAEQNSSDEETGLFGPEVESLDSDDDADTDDNTDGNTDEEQEDDKDSGEEADTDDNTDGNANLAPSDEDQEDDKDSDDEAEPPAEEPREFMMSFQDVEANTLGNLPL